jgi:pilus assembly protein CpaE
MSNVLRIAIVDPSDDSRELLKNMLLGMDVVWLEAECSRYEFFSDVVGQTNPDIGIVNLDRDAEKGLELIESLRDTNPKCSVLVISSASDGQLILRAMRAGAKEFLTQPMTIEELLAALGRIGDQQFAGMNGKGRTRGSKVIAVAGATGGVGSTSIAVNVGCALAAEPTNSVALVDLDLSLGDADVFLDTIPDYTLVDVAQNISRLDFTLLKRSLTKHSSGLYLLPRPVQLQDTGLVSPDDLNRVFGLLKATFSHLIIDLSKSYNALDMVAMSTATEVLLITQLDLPCLRNIVRLMMSFEEYEGLKDKIKIVVNRSGLDNGQISLKKAQETIGREIFWQLPNDYRVMVNVRNNGMPLIEQAPKASITQSIVSLASELSATGNDEETVDKKNGWLGFLSGKAKVKS